MSAGGGVYFAARTRDEGVELRQLVERPSTAEIVGTGCGRSTPRLRASTPVLGVPTIYSGDGAPAGGIRVLVYGFAAAPQAVPGLVYPGCAIWPEIRIPTVIVTHPPGNTWQLPIPLANNPSFIGIQVGVQAAYGPVPFTVSNGLQMTVGTR